MTDRRTGGPRRPRPRPQPDAQRHTQTSSEKKAEERARAAGAGHHFAQSPHMVNGAIEWHAMGQVVYVRDATKHPPGASYAIAGIIGFCCICAIFWQMTTTVIGYHTMIHNGAVWKKIAPSAQNGYENLVLIMCFVLAVGFQAPLIFFAFKVDKRFANERHRTLTLMAKFGMMWQVTMEIVAANILLSLWALISIIGDTIGDVTFVTQVISDPFLIFLYASTLYALGTVGLSESLQMLWDGMVTAEWLRQVRNANLLAEQKIREAIEYLSNKAKPQPKAQPTGGNA